MNRRLRSVQYGILYAVLAFCLSGGIHAAFDLNRLKDPRQVTQQRVTDSISDAVLFDRLDEMDRILRLYPGNFRNVDLPRAYLDAGMGYYRRQYRMLSLKTFLKGYAFYEDTPSKLACGFYAAKVLYQINRRESALFYVNRVLSRMTEKDALRGETLRLKRRIRWEYISRYEGLPDESISDLEFDGDDLWIGMWTGGVARYTRSANTLKIFRARKKGLISPHVRDIQVYGNRVYVGTYSGLCHYDKKRGTWHRETGALGRLTVKKVRVVEGTLYAATLGQGVFVYRPDTGQWENFFSQAKNVVDVVGTSRGLYIATLDKGLYFYDGKTARNVLADVTAKTVGQLEDRVWVGTHGDGIYVLDRENRVRDHLTEKDGLDSRYIETLETVSNRMVIGTLGGGAAVFQPETRSFRRLNIMGGLPSNDVVRIAFERNKVWFGTLSGGIGILLTENLEDI